MSSSPPRKRCIVYVDGFNLYYGAVRITSHLWLNLQWFFERLRNDDDVQVIRYFTAMVSGPPQANQLAYLKALTTCPKVRFILGKFKPKRHTCRVAACRHKGSRVYMAPEEKQTDVAIGVFMLDDAYQDKADVFVIVSGDSDLVPAVKVLKSRFPNKQVVVYVPTRNPRRGAAAELRGVADKDRDLPLLLLRRCQFPAQIPVGDGEMIEKPSGW